MSWTKIKEDEADYITATSMSVERGTLKSGTVSNTQTWGDGNNVKVQELTT